MLRDDKWLAIGVIAYETASWATFISLMFFDGYKYNSWNWLIAVPANVFLGHIWPIYWLILRPVLGP